MSHPLLRTLISEMVETYLEESYENDIVESIFEEVSEETWEAIEEAILNELSPKTLASYVKKAGDRRSDIHGDIQRRIATDDKYYGSKEHKKDARARSKREQGISKAVDRLAKR